MQSCRKFLQLLFVYAIIRLMKSVENQSIHNEHNGAATMRDVADRLDISLSTVSRALRRMPGINARTRARVFQAASELGYNLPASLSTGSNDTSTLHHIGVFGQMPTDGIPPLYFVGMSDAAVSLNVSLTLHYIKEGRYADILDPGRQPPVMRAGLLSGIVLFYWCPQDVVARLVERLPVVSVMHKYPGIELDVVGLDNGGGVALLMNHLYERGHRKIGFFGRCPQISWANERFAGYVAELSSSGLEYNQNWVVDVDPVDMADDLAEWSESVAAAERLVKEKQVTAFACASETAGWRLCRHFEECGISVPGDVAVTGFHRSTAGSMVNKYDLTTILASYEAIGAAALRRLLFRIQNPAETRRNILFPCTLHLGSTT